MLWVAEREGRGLVPNLFEIIYDCSLCKTTVLTDVYAGLGLFIFLPNRIQVQLGQCSLWSHESLFQLLGHPGDNKTKQV
jgi:hypothetical protein